MAISPSRLHSYIFWKKKIAQDPQRFGNITFPCPPEEWKRIGGDICPICQDFKVGPVVEETEERLYCLCSTLDWILRQKEETRGYEQSIEPAKLSDLIPYDLPVGAGAEFKKLLTDTHKWLDKPKDWMLIQGPPGTGKTHILRAIKTALPELCLYISSARLQQLGFNALDNGNMSELHSVLGNAPILLLDDWGQEHTTSFTTDTMVAIIDRRYGHPDEFITVMTTNAKLGSLIDSPDMGIRRIASRMMDMQHGKIYMLKQSDFRMPTTQAKVGGL